MKIIDILDEGKTYKVKKPRAEQLNKVLMSKKGGSHYNPKTDYVRAKEKEKARKELDEGWMPHEDGSYSAEESDIRDYIQHNRARIRCPKCRVHLDPRTLQPHTDREGDITHWTQVHDCGAKLIVFND